MSVVVVCVYACVCACVLDHNKVKDKKLALKTEESLTFANEKVTSREYFRFACLFFSLLET